MLKTKFIFEQLYGKILECPTLTLSLLVNPTRYWFQNKMSPCSQVYCIHQSFWKLDFNSIEKLHHRDTNSSEIFSRCTFSINVTKVTLFLSYSIYKICTTRGWGQTQTRTIHHFQQLNLRFQFLTTTSLGSQDIYFTNMCLASSGMTIPHEHGVKIYPISSTYPFQGRWSPSQLA